MQQATEQSLQEQLSALHTAQAQEKLRMEALLNKQAKALDVATQLQASQSQQLKELEQRSPRSPAMTPTHGSWRRPILW